MLICCSAEIISTGEEDEPVLMAKSAKPKPKPRKIAVSKSKDEDDVES